MVEAYQEVFTFRVDELERFKVFVQENDKWLTCL